LQDAVHLKQTADSQYQEALSQQPLDLAAGGACAGGEGGEAAQQLAQLSSRIADAEVRLDAADDSLTAAEQQLSALLQEHQDARAEPQVGSGGWLGSWLVAHQALQAAAAVVPASQPASGAWVGGL
jgi:hypothetical protein